MKYAARPLDGDVWTLAYEVVDTNKIRVDSYTRDNPVGYDGITLKPAFVLVEDDYSLAVGVVIDNVYYEVVNPYDVYKPKPAWAK
tara:strand:- start:63 stop:317 length:255 start_codon:yes stop_codon:yes gene_type:complete